MAIKLDINLIKKSTTRVVNEKADRLIAGAVYSALWGAAGEGKSWTAIDLEIPSLPAYGRLSFDGNLKNLRGVPRKVWDWLEENGLSPELFGVVNSASLAYDQLTGATVYRIIATWMGDSSSESPDIAKELRSARDNSIQSIAEVEIAKIPERINQAIEKGWDWAPVCAFEGLSESSRLFPFDGKKEHLSGVPKIIWDFLESQGANPRLYHVLASEISMSGMHRVNVGNGKVRYYKIAACWYDKPEGDAGVPAESECDPEARDIYDTEVTGRPTSPTVRRKSSKPSN